VLLDEDWAVGAAEVLAAADWRSAAAVYEEESFQLLPAEEKGLAALHAPGICLDSLNSDSARLDGASGCWTSFSSGTSGSTLHAPGAAERSKAEAVPAPAPAPQCTSERQAAAAAAVANTAAGAKAPLPPLPPIPPHQLRKTARLSRELASALGHLQAVREVLPGVPEIIAQLLATAKENEAMLLGHS
jgi:hypothetical protein